MENNEERVVAVIEPQIADEETEIAALVFDIEEKIERICITNDDEYVVAGKLGVEAKARMARVTEYFAPMKKAAHDAHKQVCDREKKMLARLKESEKLLQRAIGEYTEKKEQARKAAEEAARRLAQEEVERKLEEAIAAESSGDSDAANAAMLDAQIVDSVSSTMTVKDSTPKVKGVSSQKDWEITDIDLSKVPDTVAGVLIRPVDQKAIMKLIRASKGSIKIDGITYQETTKTSFRRS